MNTAEFLIAGGGIAGLAAAIALAPRETLLLEQAPKWQNVGAGLQLGPNAVRALQKLGAWDAVEPYTSSPPEIHIHDGISGKRLAHWPLGANFEARFGAPYRVAHRADLHRALLEVANAHPALTLKLDQPMTDCAQYTEGVSAASPSDQWAGKALLAADGVKSAVRQKLFPNSAPRSTGETLHRALLPANLSIAGVAMDCVNLWLYPMGHVVHYPVGCDHKLNLVAITPENQTPAAFFEKVCPALRNILAQSPNWSQWPSLYVEPLKHTSMDRILLLGDAAHGTVPYLAQGAAMALEDAAALKSSLQSETDLVRAFQRTNANRAPRTRQLHLASIRQGKIYHATGLQRQAAYLALANLPAAFAWSRLNWLYKH
jgi:salicylate hydroxylase